MNDLESINKNIFIALEQSEKLLRLISNLEETVSENKIPFIRENFISSTINLIKLSKDGKFVVIYNEIDGIMIWDLKNNECINKLKINKRTEITCLTISPSGRYIFAGGFNHNSGGFEIKIWDFKKAECIKKVQYFKECGSAISSIEITPDYKYFLTSDNLEIKIWDFEKVECIKKIEEQHEKVSILQSTTDKLLICYSNNKNILKVLDLYNKEYLKEFKEFSLEKSYLEYETLFGSDSIKLWNLECEKYFKDEIKNTDLKNIRLISSLSQSITATAITDDNRFLYTGSNNGIIKIWAFEKMKCLMIIKGHKETIRNIIIREDKNLIFTVTLQDIKSWNLHTGEYVNSFTNKYSNNDFITIDCNKKYIISGNFAFVDISKTIIISDLVTFKEIDTLRYEEPTKLHYVKISECGNYIISESDKKRIWSLSSGKCLFEIQGDEFFSISSDGNYLFFQYYYDDKTLNIYDLEHEKTFKIIKNIPNNLDEIAVNENNIILFLKNNQSIDNNIKIWDLNKESYLDEAIEIVPDTEFIISFKYDSNNKITISQSNCHLKLNTLNFLELLNSNKDNQVFISPNEKYLVYLVQTTKNIKIWDIKKENVFIH